MKKNSSISAALSVLAFLAMAVALPSHATLIPFSATIDGAQANAGAGTGSTETGMATMFLDDNTNEFSWDISWTGLTDPISGLSIVTNAHFHGPAGPGANAGVALGFDFSSNPAIGSTFLTTPQQAADLLAGLWYINIHTAANPGGEIRGQVTRVAEPGTSSLLLVSLAGLLYLRRKRH